MELLKQVLQFILDLIKKEEAKVIEKPVEKPVETVEKPKPTAKGLKYYPSAIPYKNMKTRAKYAKGYPLGAVVHFTAGRSEAGLSDAKAAIDLGITNGYAYLCIDKDGKVLQSHPIDEWGYHAGESAWKTITGAVSDDLIGIEICNAGLLTKTSDGKFMTWFKTEIPASQVRYVKESEWGGPSGYYHKYTEAQEKSLIELLKWLKNNDPVGCFSFDNVLGHNEVSGKLGIGYFRKNDPTGALSMPMSQLRALLKK